MLHTALKKFRVRIADRVYVADVRGDRLPIDIRQHSDELIGKGCVLMGIYSKKGLLGVSSGDAKATVPSDKRASKPRKVKKSKSKKRKKKR